MVAKIILALLTILPFITWAQQKDTAQVEVNHKRLRTVAIAGGAGYGIMLVGLNELWYKNTPRQPFQFFNDSREWMQVDKMGHFYSSFYLSSSTSKAYKWCGVPSSRSDLYGAVTGFMILLPIEIFDGFSSAYGASGSDLLANAGGALFFLGQQRLWGHIRISPKFSFHRTNFPKERPELLGDNLVSEILKDYNGQTYWLSFDMDKFIKFPKWLNIAIGHGAEDNQDGRGSDP